MNVNILIILLERYLLKRFKGGNKFFQVLFIS